MSADEASTSSKQPPTGCVDLESSVETFSNFLSKFQFDKAREFCEEQRLTQAAYIGCKQWQCLVANLVQLASSESHYFSLTFFSSKFSFKKDNHVREGYMTIKNELDNCYDECEKLGESNESCEEFMLLLQQLICLCTIRIKLVEFYVFLATENWRQTVTEAGQHLNMINQSMAKVLKNDIRLPQLKAVKTELDILRKFFRIQSDLLDVSFVESLIQIKEVAHDLATWFSHVPFKASASKPHFFLFAFAKTTKCGPKLLLLCWFSTFYNTLLAKLCLYSHDLFAIHIPSSEMKSLLSAQPSFLQSILSYARRVNSHMICLLLNRMGVNEDFYGFGYKNVITRFGPDNLEPINGRHGIYPALFRYPNDQKLFDTLHPSIISLIQDSAERNGSDERVRHYFDGRSNITYFTVLVEKNVHFTAVFNRKVSEKDQNVQQMFRDVLDGLRLISLINDLRQCHKN
ncbi:unnamed protein product [Bursaphelenchus xylophilus]|uniref:(pine wood nematode) hypothetical protein n=1 Tax=Bursaphelenchus xylophilus TaxID=6326 RepID=A0A1I7S9P6_BURXY|nr:unnamed protein product [Bursaphelenchus xylophilus]CAG9131906.1 unnamed protein product [Bursaphelenchus xylophilus]